MAGDFNPYHVWLGIPLKDQPANYYRLLSLDLFETSGDVIDSAADRQMAHLRTFQSGKNGELTQRLLNEVAAARVCLLDPKKKAAYDQQLRAKLAATMAPAPATGTTPQTASGSAIQRQPPRRPTDAAPSASIPTAAALPQPADQWDDLLGKPDVKPLTGAGGKSAKSAAAKRGANNRYISIGVGAGVVLIAAVVFGIYALNSPSDGTLVFDWPDRANVAVTVDKAPIEVPPSGSWEHNFPAGPHHVAAQRPAFKFATDVNLAAGQRLSVPADWKPKAVLVLRWPPGLRSGAVLKIDSRVQSISSHDPMEVPVEPGQHTIQITRPGFDPIGTSALVAADGRELVAIAAPPAGAKLVFDWPAAERKDAELIVDGSSRTIADGSDSEPFVLTLEPGRHVVHITRRGFEPFNQSVDLSAGTDSQIKPTWTPETKIATAPTIADTQVPLEAPMQPAKKLPVPAVDEQEKIAKQLNDLYKTSQPGPKDPAKAQELYDVAAKDGSSPAERYVLLMKGAEMAASAGDLNLSLQGIDAIDADYEIDALGLKQKLLDKFIAAGKPDQVAIAIPTAEQLVDQAVAADRYDIAVVLVTSASKAVAKSKIATHKEVEERLARRRHDIHLLEPIYAAAKKAQETFEKSPADPEANLTVGRWLCFYKGDWTTGLPILAKGSDEKLKALADQEIKAPTEADQQVQIADAWWNLAQKEAGLARDSLHLHAGNIYQAALPNLVSALKKAAIEKRLVETAGQSRATVATESTLPATKNRLPVGRWVDLLQFVDTARDRVSGTWTRNGTDVTCESGERSRIAMPVTIDGSYDVEVEFTRTAGRDDVATMFSVGPHTSAVTLSSWGGSVSGMMFLDGRDANNRDNPSSIRPGALTNGRRYRLLVSVRRIADDRASVDVKLDDHEYLPHWEGNLASLSETPEWAIPRLRSLGLWAQGSTVRFHSVRLRLVSGRASLDAGVATLAPPQVAPAAVVSEKPSGPPKFALNQWVDVLRFVDTTKNSVKGKWSRSESEISCNAQDVAEIQIPVVVDGSYELEVEFTRATGDADVNTIFTVGPRQCMLHLCSGGGKNAGLDWVDGRSCQDSRNPTAIAPAALDNGHRYQLLVKVQFARPNRASVDVALDGNRYLPHWEGSAESLDLSQGWFTLPNPRQLGLAIYKNHVTFHSVRLKMTSGRASVDASAVDTASPRGVPPMNASGDPAGATKFPLGQSVEVLQLVDPAKHAVAGRWSRVEDKIKVEPDNQSRIVIPVAVAGSYDLEVELNRHDGTGDLHTTLPVGSHSCDISVGQDGHIGGLESIDNRRAFDKANPITAYAPVFENDHTYHLLAKVRVSSADHASVDVSLDGKPYLPHWEGDPAILSVSKDWAMPTVDHLGLGAWRSQVTYSSVKLRMISGHATDDPASAGSMASSELPTIVKARWGRRKTWVDVTAVVKDAVAKGEVVYANSGFLKVDPTEGKKKQLQITYKLGETEQATNINEGGTWSKEDYANLKP